MRHAVVPCPVVKSNDLLLDRQRALFARSETSEPEGDRSKSEARSHGRDINGPAESVPSRSPGRCANRDAPRVDKWDLDRREGGNLSLLSSATPDKIHNFFLYFFSLQITNTKGTGLGLLTSFVCLVEMARTCVSACQVTVYLRRPAWFKGSMCVREYIDVGIEICGY